MRIISYEDAKRDLDGLMDEITDIHEPVRIERRKKGSVVLVDAEDFESMAETAYLLRSPENAKRLMQALDEFHAGEGIAIDAKAIMDADGDR
jgi:antitoxin YefM